MNDLKKWQIRTDLAYDEAIKQQGKNVQGLEQEELTIHGLNVTKHIVNEQAENTINKAKGTYYTIDLNKVDFHDTTTCENIEKTLAIILHELLIEKNLVNKKCLLVGLGNINVTPDALGPYVMDNVIVTKHLFDMNNISEGFSEVAAISPGVMGTTGLETFEIIKSVVDKINFDYLIVVDALASNSIERVNKTIQITDTGISPGSGVGNKRKELSINTIGLPVIAIGVPTIVDAVTITSEAIDYILKYLNHMSKANKPSDKLVLTPNIDENTPTNKVVNEELFGEFGKLSEEEKRALIQDILTPSGYNLMVTPKEIDADVEDLSKIIAGGINIALHQGILNHYTE